MSLPATFDDIFVRACAAKSAIAATDLAIAQTAYSGGALVSCGSGKNPIRFSAEGLSFCDTAGNAVSYSWQDLDFILPGDLSLANDKLNSFSDLDTLAGEVARIAGKTGAILAVIALAYFLISTIVGAVIWFVGGFDYYLGTFGDIVAIVLLIMGASALSPLWLPILIGVLASGGIVAKLGHVIGKNTRPLARLALAWRVGDFPNGLLVINARWVKLPWGTPTTQLVDFIMIGVKLRRRGLC